MASISNDPNGRRRLQFTDAAGRRKTIRLGKMPKRAAESVKVYVEHLVNAKVTKQPIDGETARWVASLDDVLAGKLSKVGLIQARESAKLDSFLKSYIDGRKADDAESTTCNFEQARRCLVEYFGANRDLRDISEGDADDWRQSLVDRYAVATISKMVKRARQVFRYAVRKGLADVNPFLEVKGGSEQNESRMCFIDRDTIEKVLDACPSVEWRLIVALARFGGVRTPSELLLLRWGDIDWERQRFTVTSPKTKKQGKPWRVVPLFPELQTVLADAFEQATEGAEYVIAQYRNSNANLRTQFGRILKRAGVEQWPRLFQNLRASRETELANEFPLHVATGWIGNSPKVASKHYLQTTDEHFQKAAQNPTQPVHGSGGQGMPPIQETPELSGNSIPDNLGQLLNTCIAPRTIPSS